jgi:DNA helicase HerA-like ATPase
MQTVDGRGVVNVLAADKLMNSPRLYSLFLLWLLAELFERLPEAGDLPKPKLAFFFDEAHLLFADAPPALLEKIEQVVRLIRSKGVGVYFITQNPLDIPDTVLGQLGNRVQHALRAFTPRDQKAVKSAADTMRPNPKFSAETVITELAVGEALVSFLDEQGRPTIVERALVAPPMSRIGPLTTEERLAAIAASPLAGHYEAVQDRTSAYEKLKGTTSANMNTNSTAASPVGAGNTPSNTPAETPAPADTGGGFFDSIGDMFGSSKAPAGAPARTRESATEAAFKSAARAIGSQVGREIVRGVLGSILGGRRR